MHTVKQTILEAIATEDETADDSIRITLADVARRLLPAWQIELDRIVATTVHLPHRISCRAGCGACCRQPVPLSVPEAYMLAELLNSLAAEQQGAILAAQETATDRLRDHGLLASSLLARADDYMALELPCMFLADECCSIHPQRPSACREHLVTTPPSLCRSIDRGAEPVSFQLSLTSVLANLAARLLATAPTYIPLVRVLAWCAENPDDGLRTWKPSEIRAILAAETEALLTGSTPPE